MEDIKSLLNTYQNNVTRKQNELSKLREDLAKESKKIPPLNARIIAAEKSISSTRSQTTINSKVREIQNARK